MERSVRILSELDATPASFHDCHLHGLRWQRDQFSFSMDLQYILKWLEPTDSFSGYRFSIAESRLTFKNVDDVRIEIDWTGRAPDLQIATFRAPTTRTTSNGSIQRYFEIEFAEPQANISLWSTGYDLVILHEPVLSHVTTIPVANG